MISWVTSSLRLQDGLNLCEFLQFWIGNILKYGNSSDCSNYLIAHSMIKDIPQYPSNTTLLRMRSYERKMENIWLLMSWLKEMRMSGRDGGVTLHLNDCFIFNIRPQFLTRHHHHHTPAHSIVLLVQDFLFSANQESSHFLLLMASLLFQTQPVSPLLLLYLLNPSYCFFFSSSFLLSSASLAAFIFYLSSTCAFLTYSSHLLLILPRKYLHSSW